VRLMPPAPACALSCWRWRARCWRRRMDRGLACHLLGKREPVICIRELKRDETHHWRN
jgi:hypothetical protein